MDGTRKKTSWWVFLAIAMPAFGFLLAIDVSHHGAGIDFGGIWQVAVFLAAFVLFALVR